VAYRSTSLRAAKNGKLGNIIFCGDHLRPPVLSDREKGARLATLETNFNFYDDVLHKYLYDGPKSMTGIQIPVQLDLFGERPAADSITLTSPV
jgi:hypothetical protein